MSLKLCYSNLVDLSTTTITANSSESSLPVSNIKTFWKSKVHRATGDAAEWDKFDFGSAKPVQVVIIVGHNYSSGSTVVFEMNATDAWGAPSVQETITWNGDIMILVLSSAETYRWARITIADGSNPDGYVEEGRAFLGGFLGPERDFMNGWERNLIDPSVIGEAFDGASSIDEKEPYYVFSFPFENTLPDDMNTVWEDRKLIGDLFLVADSGNDVMTDGLHDLSRYVLFSENPGFSGSFLKRQNFVLSFKELIG